MIQSARFLAFLWRCCVADFPRLRLRDESMITVNLGVAIVTAPSTSISLHPVGSPPSTFEVVAGFVTNGRHRADVVVIYRPSSQQSQNSFLMTLPPSSSDWSLCEFRYTWLEILTFVLIETSITSNSCGRLFDPFCLKVGSSGPTHSRVGSRGPRRCFRRRTSVDCSDHAFLRWPEWILIDQSARQSQYALV